MNWQRKIRASAMQFAILVSVIIAVLLGSYLILTHTHSLFRTKSKLSLKKIDEANLGIQYALNTNHRFNDSINIQNENIETTIKKSFWGGFEKIESISRLNSKSFKKIALIGNAISNPNFSIYTSDQSLPLVLVGNTKIEGTAYISEKGIKPGSISGHYYNGNTLINGDIKYSQSSLPSLNKRWMDYINSVIDFIPTSGDLVIPIDSEIKNSFFEKEKIIYEPEEITLNESFTGNILIKSEKGIHVSKHANIKDVMLIAPKIIIEKGFKGSANFIARDSIIVKKNVTLEYPSSLIVTQKNRYKEQLIKTPIIVSENSVVKGSVIFLKSKENSKNNQSSSKPNIDLHTNSLVEGQVYCQGNTQVSGTVKGSVYTERFVTKGFGSIYVNHIFNGSILANDLSEEFCGLPLEEDNKGIVKWLY